MKTYDKVINLFREIKTQSWETSSEHWQDTNYYFDQILNGKSERSVHLAIMVEPYLTRTLTGLKTIESRFAKNRIAPCKLGSIKAKDIILIKQSGGNIKGICQAGEIWQCAAWGETNDKSLYNAKTGAMADRGEFVSKNASRLQYEPDFYESVKEKTYCAFIELVNMQVGFSIPFKMGGQAGWVVLSEGVKNSD